MYAYGQALLGLHREDTHLSSREPVDSYRRLPGSYRHVGAVLALFFVEHG